MVQALRRLVSGLLLALVAGGGGRLATVDALVFHEVLGNQDPIVSHFEASSECHDDGCSVRSDSYGTRFTAAVSVPRLILASHESAVLPLAAAVSPSALPLSGPFSRAPPLSA